MGRSRALSGKQQLAVPRSFGFEVHDQRGSHIKLRRQAPGGLKETLAIPNHAELDKGTLQAIFRQASRYVNPTDLRPHFFHDE